MPMLRARPEIVGYITIIIAVLLLAGAFGVLQSDIAVLGAGGISGALLEKGQRTLKNATDDG